MPTRTKRARRRLYPRSLLQLISVGLAVVVLPLGIALGMAAIYVERATSQSQQAVVFSTQAVRYSLDLADQLKDMERTARVYQVLAEENLLENYKRLRKDFLGTAGALRGFELQPDTRERLQRLIEQEQAVYNAVMQSPAGSQRAAAALEQFGEMRDSARDLIAANSRTIEQKVNTMKAAAAGAREALMWEAIVALALAVLLGTVVIPPVLRYMRALDRSIRQLGNGNLDRKIELQGPRDVRELGNRLEWLRRQLQEVEKQKQLYLRHFSHELKTPLASIREGASLLSDGVAGEMNDEQKEITRILQDNTAQLKQRIDDLLAYSVSMQPFQAIANEPVRLDEQMEAVLHEHRLPARSKGLRIDTRLEPLAVPGDASRLATLLDNLISNAVKYSPNEGVIAVNLYQDNGYAVVDVCDEGPGISSEEREQVFEAFYKIPDQAHSNIEGSGLGLSIAKHYALAHGGDVHVIDSQRGARLRITLPLYSASP